MIFALEIDFDQAAIDASADAFITLTKLGDAIPFTLTVSGYGRDAGELSEIPEVLAYLREWHDVVKHKGGVFDSLDEISQSLLLVACRMGSKLGRASVETRA